MVSYSRMLAKYYRKKLGLDLSFKASSKPMVSKRSFKKSKTFAADGLKPEKEASLRNHMKWTRIKVNRDGENVSKVVEVEIDGYIYTIPIWCEIPTTVVVGDRFGDKSTVASIESRVNRLYKEGIDGTRFSHQTLDHVSTSKDAKNLKLKICEEACDILNP